MRLFGNGDYTHAIVKLSAAYEGSKDHRIFFHIVTAEKNLGHHARAVELLDRFLEGEGHRLPKSVRAHAVMFRSVVKRSGVRARAASAERSGHGDLQEKATSGTLKVWAGPKDMISLDGHVVARASFAGKVWTGPHRVVVRARGKVPYRTVVVATPRKPITLHVKLKDRVHRDEDAGIGNMIGQIVGKLLLAFFSGGRA